MLGFAHYRTMRYNCNGANFICGAATSAPIRIVHITIWGGDILAARLARGEYDEEVYCQY